MSEHTENGPHHRGTGGADLFASLRERPGPDIAGSARWIGAQVWTLSRLFEITGRWAVAATDQGDTRRFAGVATRLAWLADEWRRRLPVLREVDPPDLIRAPTPGVAGDLERLAELPIGERRARLGDVLVELTDVLARHASHASPLTDGPLLRTLARSQYELARAVDELSAPQM